MKNVKIFFLILLVIVMFLAIMGAAMKIAVGLTYIILCVFAGVIGLITYKVLTRPK